MIEVFYDVTARFMPPCNPRLLPALMDWPSFSPILKRGLGRSGVGPQGYDPLVLFKCLLIGQWHGLSDPKLERVLRDENGYRVQDTEWHRITCFNGLGKTVQEYCDTGMKVMVRGRIHYTKWIDSTGNDRYGCEIIAETVDFLTRKKEDEDPQMIDREDRGYVTVRSACSAAV